MRVELATPHARGIDTVERMTTSTCAMLVRNHLDFVVRYSHGRYAIDKEEVNIILYSGLALMLVTPSRPNGWSATRDMGYGDGDRAVQVLTDLQIPETFTLLLDLEGCVSKAEDTFEWATAWATKIVQQRYIAGLYVGNNPGHLNSDDLWNLPYHTRYWRSASRVPEPANRGWCMQQLRPLETKFGPLCVDHNVIETDFKGDVPTWLVA